MYSCMHSILFTSVSKHLYLMNCYLLTTKLLFNIRIFPCFYQETVMRFSVYLIDMDT